MSFTDEKLFKLSDYSPKHKWYCNLCGYIFKDDDSLRWVNNSGGNFVGSNGKIWGLSNIFVCQNCDGPNEEIAKKYTKLMTKYEFLWNQYYAE